MTANDEVKQLEPMQVKVEVSETGIFLYVREPNHPALYLSTTIPLDGFMVLMDAIVNVHKNWPAFEKEIALIRKHQENLKKLTGQAE